MNQPLRLGIAGLGTVGTGVVKIVRQKASLLAARAGRPVEISAVSARSRDKDRGINISNYYWEDDPVALATRDDVDVFVELMALPRPRPKPRLPRARTWSPPTRRFWPIMATRLRQRPKTRGR